MTDRRGAALSRFAPLADIGAFLKPYRARIAAALVALVVAAAATLAVPWTFRSLIDFGFSEAAREAVDAHFLALFSVVTVLAIATSARFYLVSWLGERVVADVRAAVYGNVLALPPAWYETTRTGEVLSRLSSDATLVETVVGTSLSLGLRNAFLFAGGLVMMAVTSARLTALIVLLLVVVVVPIVVIGRRVRRLSRASQDRLADASALAAETLNALPTVQAFAQEQREAGRFRAAASEAFLAAVRRIRARGILTLVAILLGFGAIILVLRLGAQDVLAGRMSGGELGAFVLYSILSAGALGALVEVWSDLQRAVGAMERLSELLHARSPIEAPVQPRPLPRSVGAISFREVSFRYPSRPETAAVDQFSLDVRAGERLALVGPSGAGKSTLFGLLLRFHDPDSGAILLDGTDLRRLAFADLRRAIGVVPQDPVIFSADARENIRYGWPEADDARVREAAEQALADEFIRALPDGYCTFLGERGVRLSGGQRQRIAIARALIKDPALLLLDEATSALDSESDAKVQAAIDRAARSRTVIVIAHRLSTVVSADRIVVLDRGRIQAVGPHARLIETSPLYARLAALQFGADSMAGGRTRIETQATEVTGTAPVVSTPSDRVLKSAG